MKKKYLPVVICLVVVICFCAVNVYADWFSDGTAVNVISTASVKGSIKEVYETAQNVMPGATVTKTVNVSNTGTANMIARVKIDKVWGYSRDESGNLIVNEELSTDNIIIVCDTENWYYCENDGYYYYKDVLSPNQTTETPLFKEFTISPYTGNEYKNMEADIRVKLECIQAANNGIEYWGMTYDELGIDYVVDYMEETVTSVEFVSPSEGFEFSPETTDLFANFKYLLPGDGRTQIIDIKNNYTLNSGEELEIFLYADYIEQTQATEETKNEIERLLKEYVSITVTDDNGNIIYSGAVWGNLDSASNGNDTMKNKISLGQFKSDDTKRLMVSLNVASSMENASAELLGYIKWVFSANGTESDIPPNVVTGDSTNTYIYILIMVLSFTCIFVLFVKGKHEK